MRRDKYARANALSKIFEELLARNSGDKKAAKEDMDNKLGKEWQLEIVIDDEIGPEFIDPGLLDSDVEADGEEIDEMFKAAREYSEDFVRPGDDMEYDPKEKPKEGDSNSIACLLRKLADKLEGK